jgi:hypothetical protein
LGSSNVFPEDSEDSVALCTSEIERCFFIPLDFKYVDLMRVGGIAFSHGVTLCQREQFKRVRQEFNCAN